MIASWVSVRLRLNSRIPFPKDAPDLGQPLGPEEQQDDQQDEHDFGEAEIGHRAPLEKRPSDQIRHQDADQAQERHVQADRAQREVYHQKIGGDRAEIGGPGAGEEGSRGAVGQALAKQGGERHRRR